VLEWARPRIELIQESGLAKDDVYRNEGESKELVFSCSLFDNDVQELTIRLKAT
jgi:hypothetical protein